MNAMTNKITSFKYHPNPLKTGNAIEKQFVCVCCNREKNYSYIGPIYSACNIEGEVCLDCIQNGSASEKFNAEFADNLDQYENISESSLNELFKRTPGYNSWQSTVWLTHCNEICEFHGDFEKNDIVNNYETLKSSLLKGLGYDDNDDLYMKDILKNYNPRLGTNPSFYKFVCCKCRKVLVHVDFS